MRDSSRDVFHDRESKTYRKSSTWKRRLRRLARKHAAVLLRNEKKYGADKGSPRRLELVKEWLKQARNG